MTPPEPRSVEARADASFSDDVLRMLAKFDAKDRVTFNMLLHAAVQTGERKAVTEAQAEVWEAAADFVETDRKGNMNSVVDGYIGWWAYKFRARATALRQGGQG